jgi:TonB family protein
MVQNDFYGGPNARVLAAGSHSPPIIDGRFGNAVSVSALAHAVGLCLLIVAGRMWPSQDTVASLLQEHPRLAWIAPGSEGGSRGNRAQSSRTPERRGVDAVAVPTNARSVPRTLEPTPAPLLDLPVVSITPGVHELPGVLTAITSMANAGNEGPGAGSTSGSGRGPGHGPGEGSGPGQIDGLGQGYQPGNGVSPPRLIREVKPGYTSDAMRARIQGTVRVQAIVAPDGSVSAARVIRSLDERFGLDQEALKTIKQWRFRPGMLADRAVPTVIEIELTFTLR